MRGWRTGAAAGGGVGRLEVAGSEAWVASQECGLGFGDWHWHSLSLERIQDDQGGASSRKGMT